MLFPVTYSANADVILTPPRTSGTNGTPNPYLVLGGLRPLADVVSRAMLSGPNSSSLRAKGVTGSYSVATDPTTNSPVLVVTADGATAAATMRNLRLVAASAPKVLDQLQSAQAIPEGARAHAQVISVPTTAGAVHKSQIRAAVVALVLGLIATLVAVTVADLFLLQREQRRAAQVPVRAVDGDDAGEVEAEDAAAAVDVPAAASASDQPVADEPPAERPRPKVRAGRSRRRTPVLVPIEPPDADDAGEVEAEDAAAVDVPAAASASDQPVADEPPADRPRPNVRSIRSRRRASKSVPTEQLVAADAVEGEAEDAAAVDVPAASASARPGADEPDSTHPHPHPHPELHSITSQRR